MVAEDESVGTLRAPRQSLAEFFPERPEGQKPRKTRLDLEFSHSCIPNCGHPTCAFHTLYLPRSQTYTRAPFGASPRSTTHLPLRADRTPRAGYPHRVSTACG